MARSTAWVDGNKMGVRIGAPDEKDVGYKHAGGIGCGNWSGCVTLSTESPADRMYRKTIASGQKVLGFMADRYPQAR